MENQQQQSSGVPYIRPPRDTFGSAIILLTDPQDELHNFELFLRNCRELQDGTVNQLGAQLVNDEGIARLLGLVQAVANKNYEMGQHERMSVTNLMTFANDTITRDLMANRVHYEIKSNAARDSIHFTSLATIYGCLNRGYEGGERRFWKGSVMELRQNIEQPKKDGFLSSFWKK